MKVKMHNTRFSKKENQIIPIPTGFTVYSGSENTGSGLIIQDNETGSLYRWLNRELAIELINANLNQLHKFADNATYKKAAIECESLKERIAVCHSVFQKVTRQVSTSMTFRIV